MKRIRLTETQLNKLKIHITEDKKTDIERRFLTDTRAIFTNELKNAKRGDSLFIATGDMVSDEYLDWEYLNYLAFEVKKVDGDEITLEYIISDLNIEGLGNHNYILNTHQSLQFNNGDPYLLLEYEIDSELKTVKIRKYLMSEIVHESPNSEIFKKGKDRLIKKGGKIDKKREEEKNRLEKENKTKAEAEEFKRKSTEVWKKGRDTIMKSMIFEPSFLGMDNIFFFPKGYIAMDSILQKYGLNVDSIKNEKDNNELGEDVKFKINGTLSYNNTDVIAKNTNKGPYTGTYNKNDRTIYYKNKNIKFKLLGTAEIVRGSSYQTRASINGTVLGYTGTGNFKLTII